MSTQAKHAFTAEQIAGAKAYRWRNGDPHHSTVPEYWLQLAISERASASKPARTETVESTFTHLRNAETYEAHAAALFAKSVSA